MANKTLTYWEKGRMPSNNADSVNLDVNYQLHSSIMVHDIITDS